MYWHLFGLREKGQTHFCSAQLSDSNEELMNCYRMVRDNVYDLIELLSTHRERHNKDYYYKIRALKTEQLSEIERAARFIYLNKTCYNGLYRVNRSGQFNVPMGSYKNPTIFDADELITSSQALQGVQLQTADFRAVLNQAQAGDFVYFDPPYVPVSRTASFTSYTAEPFGEQEQRELAHVFAELHQRGCMVMLSNSWTPDNLERYQRFTCIEVKAARAINANPERRGKISEMVVINDER